MVGAISGYNFSWSNYAPAGRPQDNQNSPVTADQPEDAVKMQPQQERHGSATGNNFAGIAKMGLPLRDGIDLAAMAVRMRIQYADGSSQGVAGPDEQAAEAIKDVEDAKSAQEVFEEGVCQTCAERKYQDGSDDPGVSFKAPAHIDSSVATAVVRGHEMEHVVREQAKADREDREVVSQSVTLHNSICPECGKIYTSGGTTRTVTAAANKISYPRVGMEDEAAGSRFNAVA